MRESNLLFVVGFHTLKKPEALQFPSGRRKRKQCLASCFGQRQQKKKKSHPTSDGGPKPLRRLLGLSFAFLYFFLLNPSRIGVAVGG